MTTLTDHIMRLLADNSTEFCKDCPEKSECEGPPDKYCGEMIRGTFEGWVRLKEKKR